MGRGITLNSRGKACFADVRHILAEIRDVIERHRNGPQTRLLSVVAVESLAERWLMPRLADFNASWPDITIKVETDLLVDHNSDDYDVWITYAGEARSPSPETARHETLFEEARVPVCTPALLATRGRPRDAAELHSWPLLYHLGWPSDWSSWFVAQGVTPPDLSRASGFRLCSMLVRAALEGMGATIGCPTWVASELEQGALVPVFDRHAESRATCCLITTAAARSRPQVRAFRDWVLRAAAEERSRAASSCASDAG